MNMTEMREAVGKWSQKNFGDQPRINTLIGVIEELGELAHAHLKIKQGIRGTVAEHEAEMRDAIGDIMIYLFDYCYRARITLHDTQYAMIDYRSLDARLFNLLSYIDVLIASEIDGSVFDSVVYQVINELKAYCASMHFNFDECVKTAWEEVSKRDWKASSKTGKEAKKS